MKAEAVIPSKAEPKGLHPHNEAVYKHRKHIERCFGRM